MPAAATSTHPTDQSRWPVGPRRRKYSCLYTLCKPLKDMLRSTYSESSPEATSTSVFLGWPLRNPVAASRSSRHQSKNRPIFFARSRSSLVLEPFTVFAVDVIGLKALYKSCIIIIFWMIHYYHGRLHIGANEVS